MSIPRARRIYIANEDEGYVTVIERADGKVLAEVPVGVEPEGMAVSPDNKFTVATSEQTSMAHFIDNATFKVTANVLVDTRPRVAEFTRDGKLVWVTAEIGGTVAVIDPVSRKVVKKFGFQIPGVRPELIQPMGVRFTKDGKTAFVALSSANRVAVVDTETYHAQGVHSRRAAAVAHGAQSRGHEALCRERPHQRHDGRRRRDAQAREVGPRRPAAVGGRDQTLTAQEAARPSGVTAGKASSAGRLLVWEGRHRMRNASVSAYPSHMRRPFLRP